MSSASNCGILARGFEPGLARRILDHLRLASQAPPLAPARAADPAEGDARPDYGADPVYED